MRIGNVEIKNNIALAPMAGVTALPFRLYARAGLWAYVYKRWSSPKQCCITIRIQKT